MRRTLTAALALPLLLGACTGTEEIPPNLRLVVADVSGSTLRAYNPESRVQTATRASDVPVVSLLNTEGGDRMVETRTTGARFINSALTPGGEFTAVTPAPCFVRARTSAARDQIGILSACAGETQRVALYRADGTLIWQATLPPPTPTTAQATRFAVTEDSTITVARPNDMGGSDVLRIRAGVPATLFTSNVVINDLAAYRTRAASGTTTLYAATNTNVRAVNTTTTPGLSDTVVISGKATRLYTSLDILAAWDDDTDRVTFWNGTQTPPEAPDRTFPDLRDLTVASDGYAYALSGSTVTRLDTQALTTTGSWTPTDIITGLINAQAITWATPAEAPATP